MQYLFFARPFNTGLPLQDIECCGSFKFVNFWVGFGVGTGQSHENNFVKAITKSASLLRHLLCGSALYSKSKG